MKSDQIAHWDSLARKNFTYSPDGSAQNLFYLQAKGFGLAADKNYLIDNWLSHADDVLKGTAWFDDCDGLASTVLDLCARDGAMLRDRYFLIVMADPGDGVRVGHAVGAMEDDDGKFWIVGDTFVNHPYLAQNMLHKPVMYHHQFEPITVWREGLPWEIVNEA